MRWVVLGLVTGCYAPAPPEGAPCGDGLRPCPTGQTCAADNHCYTDPQPGLDGMSPGDGPPGDTPPATTCVPRRLLAGTGSVESQGWTVERSGGSSTINISGGMITLTTSANARQLIVLRDAFPPDRWSIRVVGAIIQSGGCTPGNAAAAIMAGFHGPMGDDPDRARMLCLSETAASWGDGTITVGVDLSATGTITLERTGSSNLKATIQAASGMASMSGGGFTSNGTIAIGDQTMAAGLDSTIRIATVDLLCP